jgi:hypothetical protein
MKTFILAGGYQEYADFLKRSPESERQNDYYITSWTTLLDCGPGKLIRIGTWQKRKDVAEIMRLAVENRLEVIDDPG